MKVLRSKRRLAGLGLAAAVVGTTLWLVLPAVGSTSYPAVLPASTAGVTPDRFPIGGQSNICGTLFPGFSGSEFDVNNPKTTNKPLSAGNGVTFSITVDPPNTGNPANGGGTWPAYDRDKYLSLQASGAGIVGVGINGGTDTTRYDYSVVGTGLVKQDGYLHAPAQSVDSSGQPTQLYSLSHLSICYVPLATIRGTVYQDSNLDGANNDSSPLAGWTVRLYGGVTPGTKGGGSVLQSLPTDANGGYSFAVPVNGTHYRVCEVPTTSPPAGTDTWAESQPLPSTPSICGAADETIKGYDFTPTSSQDLVGDFGNVGALACSDNVIGPSDYQTKPATTCAEKSNTYVFKSGTLGTDQAYVGYWTGDQTQAPVPVVEKVTLTDPIVDNQPKYTHLLYVDAGGLAVVPAPSQLQQMLYCTRDPRDGTEFGLVSPYDTVAGSAQILPSTSQTSCAISIRTYVDADGNGWLQAYVYSTADSFRTSG